MPDDLIHCPACSFQLRLPHELYGSPVECPQCHTRFTAPVPAVRPAPAPPPGREYDAAYHAPQDDDYRRPAGGGGLTAAAIALLVVGLLSTLIFGIMARASIVIKSDPAQFDQLLREVEDRNPNIDQDERDQLRQLLGWFRDNGAVACGIEAALNLITVLGAIMMLVRRGYGLAMLGCVLALNPTNLPGCILQMPFGIWGLVALFSESGRRSFR
jgi:hypothetical protein